jgi:hypothetical protein
MIDPITVIVTALVTGAAGMAGKDAFEGFKRLILDRYGKKSEVTEAVAQLERKPDSAGRKVTLQEELTAAGGIKTRRWSIAPWRF